MLKRITSIFLTLCLIITMIPSGVFAAENVNITIEKAPKVDIVLATGSNDITGMDVTNFETDIRAALKSLGVDDSTVQKIQTVETVQGGFSAESASPSTIYQYWEQFPNPNNYTLQGSVLINAVYDWNGYSASSRPGSTTTFNQVFIESDSWDVKDFELSSTYAWHGCGWSSGYIFHWDKTTDTAYKLCAGVGNKLLLQKVTNVSSYMGQQVQFDSIGTILAQTTGDFPTSGSGKNLKVSMKGSTITISQNGTTILTYTDPNPIKQGGIGLWAGCTVAYKDVQISYMKQIKKSFTDLLKESSWSGDALRVIVNVNDYREEDFHEPDKLASILSRCVNERLNYVAWGPSSIKQSSETFITANNNNGIYVQTTNQSSYSSAIQQTALYIKSILDAQKYQGNDYVLVNQDINMNVTPVSFKYNTATTDYPNGRWLIKHDNTYYPNPNGQYEKTDIYQLHMDVTSFDRVGKYEIFFEDDPVKTVYIHRKPIAAFSFVVSSNVFTIVQRNSYDLDNTDNSRNLGPGIAAERWKYRASNSNTWVNGVPTTLASGVSYVVQLEVQDYQGEWSEPITKYISGSSAAQQPIADFNFSAQSISKYNSSFTITNASYDPKSYDITQYTWTVVKDSKTTIYNNQSYTSYQFPPVNFLTYGAGTYAYTLKVKNAAGLESEPFTKFLTVVEDTEKPEIEASPVSGNWGTNISSHTVSIKITDTDSKLKQFRYAITASATAPAQTASNWTGTATFAANTSTSNKTVTVTGDGTKYVHIEAIDNAGNRTVITRGPFRIDTVKPGLTYVGLIELDELPFATTFARKTVAVDHVGNKKIQITVNATDSTSKVNRVMYRLDDNLGWLTASNNGGGDYIFRINDTYVGDVHVVAYDNAGHASDELVLTGFRLANSLPIIQITNNTLWQNGNPVVFPVQIYDAMGLMAITSATFETSETTNKQSGNLRHTSGNQYYVDLYNEGEYVFTVHAVNEATAQSWETSQAVRIDRTPPVIHDDAIVYLDVLPKASAFSMGNIITNRGIKIDLYITDNLSGFDYLEYQLPGRTDWIRLLPGEKSIVIEEEVSGDVKVKAWDVAGNVTQIYTVSGITIDATEPEITLGRVPEWTNQDVEIDVTVTDDVGLESIRWFTTESPDQPTAQGQSYAPDAFPSSILLSNEGVYTFIVSAFDKAGNIKKVESERIRIDKTKPEIYDISFFVPQTSLMSLIPNEEIEEEEQDITYTLTTKWIDEDNNPLADEDIQVLNENDDYTTDKQDFEGYEYKGLDLDSDSVSGIMDEDKTVVYVYSKITEPIVPEENDPVEEIPDESESESKNDEITTYTLTVKYEDVNENSLNEDVIEVINKDETYSTEKLDIDGYEFKEMKEGSNEASGVMDCDKTVIYVYSEIEIEEDPVQSPEPDPIPEEVSTEPEENSELSATEVPMADIFAQKVLIRVFPRDMGNVQSGVDKVWYRLTTTEGQILVDGEELTPDSENMYCFYIDSDFTGTITAWCRDIAGNMSDEYSEDIVIDLTNPNPSLDVTTPYPEWNTVPGVITIRAEDYNGLNSVWYSQIPEDMGEEKEGELLANHGSTVFNDELIIYDDGIYDIGIIVEDTAGNITSVEKELKVDRTIPVINEVYFHELSEDGTTILEENCTITNNRLLVEVDVFDNLSGFSYMEYQTMDSPIWYPVAAGITEFSIATGYKGNIKIRIYDKAGNMSTVFVSEEITVETEGPTLIVSRDEAWTSTGVTLNIDANDPLSGLESLVYYYTPLDGIEVYEEVDLTSDKINTDIFFDAHGSYDITFVATDVAGNTTTVVRRVNIDRTVEFPAPDINSHGYVSGTWSDRDILVSLGYNDPSVVPISGIKKYQYKFEFNDQWIDGVPELTGYIDDSFQFRAISNVGCISNETRVFVARIDKVAPVIIAESVENSNSNEPLRINFEVIEEESGIKIVEYSSDSINWTQIYSEIGNQYVIDLGDEYMGNIYIKATDICGNISDIYMIGNLVIDFDRPRLKLIENSDVKDVIKLEADEVIKKGKDGYIRIYDTYDLEYMAPLAELHISNNRIKVEGRWVYINMAGLIDGQHQYAVEADEGVVWDRANNPCYPMEYSYLGTSDKKTPALINVLVINPKNGDSYPAIFDKILNEYNVIIPTNIVGDITITPIFDLEVAEIMATSEDVKINYVGRDEIGITIDDDYLWPISLDIQALAGKTTVNFYRGDVEVKVNETCNVEIDELEVMRAVDIVSMLEDDTVYTLVVDVIEDCIYEEDEELAQSFINTTGNFQDLSTGFDIEISLYKTRDGEMDDGTVISELQNNLNVTFTIPEYLMDRDAYGIVRIHNGKAAMLKANVNYNKITFSSDKFSTYYIAVGEKVEIEVPETIIKDWSEGVPNDIWCIVPSLIGNDAIISRFSYVDENNIMNFIKPVAGNYHLRLNHVTFPDVHYDWAYGSIHALAARNLISGYSDGNFKPNNTITRAQLVTILVRLENFPLDYTRSSFKDVSVNDWHFQYIEAAYQAGLISGVGEKQFVPDRYITRQELAMILYRYLEYKGKFTEVAEIKYFVDQAVISEWAREGVNAIANAGIINGYEDGTFRPYNNATRAETAAMIWRFIQYTVNNTIDVHEITSYSEVNKEDKQTTW